MTDVTIENVLTDNLYNDLGFIANNKLMILIEAQSTWTMNILVRVLLYLAQSYHKSRKVKMPKPELYVIFTGNKGRQDSDQHHRAINVSCNTAATRLLQK